MKWVTRDHVHMDRVASPWLIKRFVDPDAEFIFRPFGREHPLPEDAIPFAIPGVEIGPHDASGSTFRKIMDKYGVANPALTMMAEIIESGVTHVFHHHEPDYSVANLKFAEGVGLDSLAHGMMYATASDAENVAQSMIIYDALYSSCRVALLLRERPDIRSLAPPLYWDTIRDELHRREQSMPLPPKSSP